MGYLLLPPDEREFVSYICGDLGLKLLIGDLAPGGVAKIASNPVAVLPESILDAAGPSVHRFVFWCADVGPIQTLGTAVPNNPVDRVLIELNRQGTPEWHDLVDYNRSPVLRWERCHWQSEDRLASGQLAAMSIPRRLQPPELLVRFKRATRWLRTGAERLNPFEHCSDTPVSQPANLGPFWVWARPNALAWVRRGGEVWPWNA